MDILYVSSFSSRIKFSTIFANSQKKPVQQSQKYHRLMVEGLARNLVTLEVISSLTMNRAMYSQLIFRGFTEIVDEVKYRYLFFINYPVFRHICLLISCFHYTKRWCSDRPDGTVICDVLDITTSFAALLAAKISNNHTVGIVTDIPAVYAKMRRERLGFIKKLMISMNTAIMNNFNAYIFLTEEMNELVNAQNKPYIVLEGHVDIKMGNSTNKLTGKYKRLVCVYAGALHRIYGIKTLTEAFIKANITGAELHIYGSGDFEEELRSICKENRNIKYFGVVENKVVVNEQLKATLLINPRPTGEEYTKYSFPSKNMEYMASGTPVLTTNLPGMPEEYKKYVYIIEDETIKGLTNSLKNVLSKPREELHLKGARAKEFVLDEKNNITQAAKVINMIINSSKQREKSKTNADG